MKKYIIDLVIPVVIGVILGAILTILITKRQNNAKHKKASIVCKMELDNISKQLAPFTMKDMHIQNADGSTIPFNGIAVTELPNIGHRDEFDQLKIDTRGKIDEIILLLNEAEKHRKLAIPLLNQPENNKLLNMYGTIYSEELRAAKDKIDSLKGNPLE